MSLKARATLGAIALCLGLLMVVGGSVSKSTEQIKYQRALERKKDNPELPTPGLWNAVMAVGWLLAAGGTVIVVFALRDMTRQIGDIQSNVELRMRMEVAPKQPSPKGPGNRESQ
jgi:hypothetical protein